MRLQVESSLMERNSLIWFPIWMIFLGIVRGEIWYFSPLDPVKFSFALLASETNQITLPFERILSFSFASSWKLQRSWASSIENCNTNGVLSLPNSYGQKTEINLLSPQSPRYLSHFLHQKSPPRSPKSPYLMDRERREANCEIELEQLSHVGKVNSFFLFALVSLAHLTPSYGIL